MEVFPIKADETVWGRLYIPMRSLARHEPQAVRNHDRDLIGLAADGGLTPQQACAVIDGRPDHPMNTDYAIQRLATTVGLLRRISSVDTAVHIAEHDPRDITPELLTVFGFHVPNTEHDPLRFHKRFLLTDGVKIHMHELIVLDMHGGWSVGVKYEEHKLTEAQMLARVRTMGDLRKVMHALRIDI